VQGRIRWMEVKTLCGEVRGERWSHTEGLAVAGIRGFCYRQSDAQRQIFISGR